MFTTQRKDSLFDHETNAVSPLDDDYNPHHSNPYQLINDDDGSILELHHSSSTTNSNSNFTASQQLISSVPTEHMLKHSMSDDDMLYYDNEQHEEVKEEDDDEAPAPLTTLKLVDSASATLYSQRDKYKERRDRAYSTASVPNMTKYQNKYHSLKKKFKNQSTKLQFYQEKITNIQDDAEETEEKLRKEYELKLLHLETKYLREKSAKSSLQNENEKLRQQLLIQNQELKRTLSGYSTATTNTNATVQPMVDAVPRASIQSIPTVVISHSNTPIHSQMQSPATNTPNSSNSATSSDDDEDTDSESSTSSDDDTDSESDSDNDSDDDDDEQDDTKKDEGDGSTENLINTVAKHDKKRRKKRRKIPKRLNHKIANNQPQGFWKTVWSLFGPPDVMCSCSDKR